jgi:hypothetical protein
MSKEVVDVGFTDFGLRPPKVGVRCPTCGRETWFYLDALHFRFDACGHVFELRAEDLAEALKALMERGLLREVGS